jgi:hypothetical protein
MADSRDQNQMFVTECSVGGKKMKPEDARDQMVMYRAESSEGARSSHEYSTGLEEDLRARLQQQEQVHGAHLYSC